MNLDILRRLNAARAARRAAALVTSIDGGAVRLVLDDAVAGDPLAAELRERFRSGTSGVAETAAGRVFLTVSVPPPRLVVIGAVHVSQALAPMAKIAGFDMTVVDPRTAFSTPERFPEVPVLAEWPEEALPGLGLDRFTAMAALTHDPKIDDPAIVAALAAGCFYVGALGSRKTHARRVERLRQAGVADAALARIRAPIGVEINAQSPAEIAVAVLAEIIGAWRAPADEEALAASVGVDA